MAGRSLSRSMTLSDPAKIRNNDERCPARQELPPSGWSAPTSGSARTLMDIIREEQRMHHGPGSGSVRNADDGTINWKSFKDRIRLRSTGSAFSDSDSNRGSDSPEPENVAPTEPASDDDDDDDTGAGAGAGEPMSLMALFEQTEGGGFGAFADPGLEEEEEEEEEEEYGGEEEEGGEYVCCVCMVRHKGAAFIPCGHTFCRLCSRELWVSRGNCPLCNGFILEILDIF